MYPAREKWFQYLFDLKYDNISWFISNVRTLLPTENHLGILLQKKGDLFIEYDVFHGWHALVLLCGGLNTVLQHRALELIKAHTNREEVLQRVLMLGGIVKGCQENWELCLLYQEECSSLVGME